MKTEETMKNRVMLMAAVVLFSASFAIAQGGQGQPRANKGKNMGMSEQLNLTADQKTKVEAINKKYREKQTLLNNERTAELKKVLTPEQFQKMQQMGRPHKGDARMMHKSGDGKGQMMGQGVCRYSSELGLTVDQQSKIRAIEAKYDKQRQDLKQKGKSSENAEAMKKLRASQRAEIKAVLTADQQSKLDKIMKENSSKKRPSMK